MRKRAQPPQPPSALTSFAPATDGARFGCSCELAMRRPAERLRHARLAKLTLATVPKAWRRCLDGRSSERKSGKGDSCRPIPPHGQFGQDCRFPRPAPDGTGAASPPRESIV